MNVRELIDELEHLTFEEPETEDFEVFFVLDRKQYSIKTFVEGLSVVEREDDQDMDRDGEDADLNVDKSHAAGVWLFTDPKTMKPKLIHPTVAMLIEEDVNS